MIKVNEYKRSYPDRLMIAAVRDPNHEILNNNNNQNYLNNFSGWWTCFDSTLSDQHCVCSSLLSWILRISTFIPLKVLYSYNELYQHEFLVLMSLMFFVYFITHLL